MITQAGPQPAAIVLEQVDPAALGMDPDAPAATELMLWCATALSILALDVSTVRFVITGDFVESVRQRSTVEHQQQNYDVRRNSGAVGAKTMSLADGGIDVLLHAAWFGAGVTDEQRHYSERLVKRTIVHEAQHVAMAQAGESAGSYEHEPWARRNFLTIADQVIEEYRAEAAVGPALRDDDGWDCIDLLATLSDDLKRIVDEYQTHLDVSRLSYQAGQETHTAWKILTYVAAAHLRDDGVFEPLPDTTTTHSVWRRMVGSHWEPFLDILVAVPPGSERIDRDELEASIADLATEFQAWLETIGFQFYDDEDSGEAAFYIVRRDLP